MLYKLDEWEHNGRDDSDWYAVVFDSDTNELRRIEIGTTRFANALHVGPPMEAPTPEILLQAEKCLADIIFGMIKRSEAQNVLEPNDVNVGDRVRLIFDVKNMIKECDEEVCDRCNGTGFWMNPNNHDDKRECFACKRTGKVKKNWRPVLENGKKSWKKIAAGTSGYVVNCVFYGKTYLKGYNSPGRFNRQVIFRTDDGVEVKASLDKLRLDREPLDDVELAAKARDLAKHRNFYLPFRTAGIRL
jgi:hypothetical protein